MTVAGRRHRDRKPAGMALLEALLPLLPGKPLRRTIGEVGGFALLVIREEADRLRSRTLRLALQRMRLEQEIEIDPQLTPLGLIARLEHALNGMETELAQQQRRRAENERRLQDYASRTGRSFELAGELELKRQAMAELLAELAQPPRWRRLSELGPLKQGIDHVLMSLAWQQPIVCRWDGSRWRTRAPNARRGTDLLTRLGPLEQPGWCIELPSLIDQIQVEIDATRDQAAASGPSARRGHSWRSRSRSVLMPPG